MKVICLLAGFANERQRLSCHGAPPFCRGTSRTARRNDTVCSFFVLGYRSSCLRTQRSTHVHRDQANGVLAGAGAARQGALSHRARVALADRHPAEECEGSAQGKGCTRSGEVAPAVNRHDVEERLHSCALGTRAKVIAVECTPCNRRGRSRGHSSRQASSPVIASQRRCCTEPAQRSSYWCQVCRWTQRSSEWLAKCYRTRSEYACSSRRWCNELHLPNAETKHLNVGGGGQRRTCVGVGAAKCDGGVQLPIARIEYCRPMGRTVHPPLHGGPRRSVGTAPARVSVLRHKVVAAVAAIAFGSSSSSRL